MWCMKCMLLMYADPDETKVMSRADRDVVARKHEAIVAELTESGELVDGAGLDYPWTTTTLRWGANPVAVDGPLVGTREQLAAYYVVDCASRQRALEVADRLLDFHVTAVEVRGIHT